MVQEKNLSSDMAKITCKIPLKLPSLNDFIKACCKGWGARKTMKSKYELLISEYIKDMPIFKNPVFIEFHWVEENHRRDLDNIAFAKKFILDAMVKSGKLIDDRAKFVTGFKDTFSYDTTSRIILKIKEQKNGGKKNVCKNDNR